MRRSRYPSASPARPSLEKQASLARVMSQAALGLRFMLTAGFGRSKRVCCFSSPLGGDFSRSKTMSARWHQGCRLTSATLHYNSFAGCTRHSYKGLHYWSLDHWVSHHPAIIRTFLKNHAQTDTKGVK